MDVKVGFSVELRRKESGVCIDVFSEVSVPVVRNLVLGSCKVKHINIENMKEKKTQSKDFCLMIGIGCMYFEGRKDHVSNFFRESEVGSFKNWLMLFSMSKARTPCNCYIMSRKLIQLREYY